jgi:hypothetical protein
VKTTIRCQNRQNSQDMTILILSVRFEVSTAVTMMIIIFWEMIIILILSLRQLVIVYGIGNMEAGPSVVLLLSS